MCIRDRLGLVCCNTQDSEAIDIYTFILNEQHSLKRQFNALNFFGSIKELITEREVNNKKLNFEKLGIVMKFTRDCESKVIFIGTESGLVLGFKIHDNISFSSKIINNRDFKENKPKSGLSKLLSADDQIPNAQRHFTNVIELVYVSDLHCPNPILDLEIKDNILLSCSTLKKIGSFCLKNISAQDSQTRMLDSYKFSTTDNNITLMREKNLKLSDNSFYEIPFSNVSHVQSTKDYILAADWKGETFVFSNQREISTLTPTILATFEKSRSSIPINESSKGNLQNVNSSSGPKKANKSKVRSIIALDSTTNSLDETLHSNLELMNKRRNVTKSMTPGQQRRLLKFAETSWCIIGYDDGCISLHDLNDTRAS